MDLLGETSDSLTIPNVSIADGGDYTCIASNAAGSDNSTSMLLVIPTIITQPVDQRVSNGSTIVTLTCEAESFPDPVYKWGRYNKENTSFSAVRSGPVLKFFPAVFGDEGRYRCVASLPRTNRSVTSRPALLEGRQTRLFTMCMRIYITCLSVTVFHTMQSLPRVASVLSPKSSMQKGTQQWSSPVQLWEGLETTSPGLECLMVQLSQEDQYFR